MFTPILAMIGWPEWLVIGLVAILLFGRRLPEVGRSLGQGLVEFKKGLKGVDHELKDVQRQVDASGKDNPSV